MYHKTVSGTWHPGYVSLSSKTNPRCTAEEGILGLCHRYGPSTWAWSASEAGRVQEGFGGSFGKDSRIKLFLTFFPREHSSGMRVWWFPNFLFISQTKKQPRVKNTSEDDLDDVSALCSSEAIWVTYMPWATYITRFEDDISWFYFVYEALSTPIFPQKMKQTSSLIPQCQLPCIYLPEPGQLLQIAQGPGPCSGQRDWEPGEGRVNRLAAALISAGFLTSIFPCAR